MGRDVMVGLHEIVHEDLPVEGRVEDRGLLRYERTHLVFGEHLAHRGERLSEGIRRTVEVHEDPPLPDLRPDLRQRAARRVEGGYVVHVRRADEGAVETVGPEVVGALERASVPAAGHDLRGTMATDPGEDADLALEAVRHDEVLAE